MALVHCRGGRSCWRRWRASAGLHFIGASVIALFLGMIVNAFPEAQRRRPQPGIKFTSKKILKFAIILLGASLNIRTVLTVGRFSLTVMVFTLATCFGLGCADRQGAGAELENEQPHQRGHGHLRRLRPSRPSRRSSRRDGHGYRLRPVGNVPVRYGDDRGVPDSGARDGPFGRGVRPLGRARR